MLYPSELRGRPDKSESYADARRGQRGWRPPQGHHFARARAVVQIISRTLIFSWSARRGLRVVQETLHGG